MAPADGLAALEQRRARATAGKRRLPPARHPKAEQPPPAAVIAPEPAASEPEAAHRLPAPPPLKAVESPTATAELELAHQPPPRRRNRVRATQVHLDEAADEHLNELRKRAVLGDIDLTSSAVLRLALTELVERHGYDGIVTIFAEDDAGRIRRGRPRT